MSKETQAPIVEFCQHLLSAHGDSPAGVGWTGADADVRYRVMLESIRERGAPCTLLDFGCGAGHLLEHLRAHGPDGVDYHGLDASAAAIELCRSKFPGVPFECRDVLAPEGGDWPSYDYIVMNGIFTYRGGVDQDAMFDYCRRLLRAVFPHVRVGLAFNVMSKQVDWERDDLFHLPTDHLLGFLARELSRHVVVRHDYGLYEYTVYVYAAPSAPEMAASKPRIERSPG
ncbi:MAG TPA: class I SAM-dependent methyltransferase [Gammaproteobacteria bacterium]|nr:class I SAM-dependent methyltransferase [Gammaproteobacteria bacterium]